MTEYATTDALLTENESIVDLIEAQVQYIAEKRGVDPSQIDAEVLQFECREGTDTQLDALRKRLVCLERSLDLVSQSM